MTRHMWLREPGAAGAWVLNLILAAVLGGTALAMPGRFTAHAYDSMRDSLGINGWGVLLVAYSVALAVTAWRSSRVTRWVFTAGAVVYAAISGAIAVSFADPVVSPWGIAIFATISLWQISQAVAYYVAARRDS